MKSLNAFHEKYLLYQDVIAPKRNGTLEERQRAIKQNEQTIKHAMLALLKDDYGRETKRILAAKIQKEDFTVVSFINDVVALQNMSYMANGKRDQSKSAYGKRKNNDDHDGFKRQNTSDHNGRNGKSTTPQFDRPTCQICGKRHVGKCTNQQALRTYYANKKASSNGNTSSLPICDLCGKPGHIMANCHKKPGNEAAKAEWVAKKQQNNIRNGKPNFDGYKPKFNTNKVNNIDVNDTNVAKTDVTMTDVVQNTTHIDPDDDLIDFDSDLD